MKQHGNSKYSVEMKLAFALGIEKNKYSAKQLRQIPGSTKHKWRRLDPEVLFSQLNHGEASELIGELRTKQELLSTKHQHIEKAFLEFSSLMENVLSKREYQKLLEKHKEQVIRWVQNQKNLTKKESIKLIGLSASKFHYWQAQVEYKCSSSPLAQCAKLCSQQITPAEAKKLRKVVAKDKWNLNALWAEGIRNGDIAMSRSTFYKYVQVLGLRVTKDGRLNKRKPQRIRAKDVHEIWHADISYFKTRDGKTSYLYVVMDNYSRAILSWRLETKIRGWYSMLTLMQAYDNLLPEKLRYITDGGPENKTLKLREFIRKSKSRIQHQIARKDIIQSNSMIERIFKTLKGEYPILLNARNHRQLKQTMSVFIQDYMDRPHGSHLLYTPREVLHRKNQWVDYQSLIEKNTVKRIARNRSCTCALCECG